MDIWLRIGRGKVYYRYLILILLSDCMISISVCYLTGSVLSPFLRSISRCGTGYQRKFSFQLNPPYVISEPAMYSNVSSLITSMMGHTTVLLWNTHTVILAIHFHCFDLIYLKEWVLSATECPFFILNSAGTRSDTPLFTQTDADTNQRGRLAKLVSSISTKQPTVMLNQAMRMDCARTHSGTLSFPKFSRLKLHLLMMPQ